MVRLERGTEERWRGRRIAVDSKQTGRGGGNGVRGVIWLLLLSVVLAGGWGLYAFSWPMGPRGETLVTIAPGMSSQEMARQLEGRRIIASRYAFEALRVIRGGTLKAGEYRFDRPRKVGEVYAQIEHGEVYTLTLTVPEGANLFDIAQRVEGARLGTAAGFLAAAKREVGLVRGLDPGALSVEGYLFPDTYQFAPHTLPEQMVAAMVRRFSQEEATLGLTGDVHRVVTLASLVERETPVAAERPLVASVFVNRLGRGMALDTDPTVIYAALLAGRYRGTIYRSDLRAESGYNTYLHAGLPPGPICNPGAVSLRAAMAPAKTDFLYFVAAGRDPHGVSRFAETLAEHEKNVAAYRHAARESGGH